MREAVARFEATLSADHVNTATGRVKLGGLLVETGRHAEAAAPLREGYRAPRPRLDPNSDWLVRAREGLVAVYDALGRPEQAARVRAEGAVLPSASGL